jgi:hypothetical protein
MIEMLAKMKLEEDMEDQNQVEKQATTDTQTRAPTATTNLNQQATTPSKRKFLKTSHSTQVVQEVTYNNATKSSMVSLTEKANQGQ